MLKECEKRPAGGGGSIDHPWEVMVRGSVGSIQRRLRKIIHAEIPFEFLYYPQ